MKKVSLLIFLLVGSVFVTEGQNSSKKKVHNQPKTHLAQKLPWHKHGNKYRRVYNLINKVPSSTLKRCFRNHFLSLMNKAEFQYADKGMLTYLLFDESITSKKKLTLLTRTNLKELLSSIGITK